MVTKRQREVLEAIILFTVKEIGLHYGEEERARALGVKPPKLPPICPHFLKSLDVF